MIYLNAECVSGLGEDTFWTWFHREFPHESQFGLPDGDLQPDDIVLRYSTLGPVPRKGGKTVALLWELYPEMRDRLGSNAWDGIIERTHACAAAADYRVAATPLMAKEYARHGQVDVLPIGVNTNLFAPVSPEAKQRIRERYGIPPLARVGFWCGTTHQMKGYDRLWAYAALHPEINWVVVWKTVAESAHSRVKTVFEASHITQDALADLMRASDFFLSTGRLRPFFMVEWEAMASGLPFVTAPGVEKEFIPSHDPRRDVFSRCWDRVGARANWHAYLTQVKRLCK